MGESIGNTRREFRFTDEAPGLAASREKRGDPVTNDLYPMIFKRKSFHLFRNVGDARIEEAELKEIETAWASFEALYPGIRTAVRIVPAQKVNFKRDAEYCVMLYSEKKENYLLNMGYLGEQLDLYLVSRNIGTLWFGIGKPDEKTHDGLDYVIMIAIHKIRDVSLFRKDMFKSKRRLLKETWVGDTLGVAEIARFTPSACNTQPWYVRCEDGTLLVSRRQKPLLRGIMPVAAVAYYNRIDMGIYLCILEICMAEKGIGYARELFVDQNDEKATYSKVAVYHLRAS